MRVRFVASFVVAAAQERAWMGAGVTVYRAMLVEKQRGAFADTPLAAGSDFRAWGTQSGSQKRKTGIESRAER